MKGKIKTLAALLCAGILFMAALDGLSGWKTQLGGGFTRLYPPHLLTAGRSINLGVNSYYFAGASGAGLVLGNFTNPRVALQVRWQVLDTAIHMLVFPSDGEPSLAARLWVQDSNLVVTDCQEGAVYNGSWPAAQLSLVGSFGMFGFNQACVLSPSRIAIRKYDGMARQNILSLYEVNRKRIGDRSGLLTKQVDGAFCVEGKMQAGAGQPRCVYTYLFRNQYLVMDTGLNLLYRGRTIDTNSTAKIKVAIENGGRRTEFAAPPVQVNRLSALDGNRLLVASMVTADNDPKEVMEENAIIDVYDLATAKYVESFYLSKEGHRRLSDIWVYRGVLYAIIDAYLYTYKLG
jgi:hypothetical protein